MSHRWQFVGREGCSAIQINSAGGKVSIVNVHLIKVSEFMEVNCT